MNDLNRLSLLAALAIALSASACGDDSGGGTETAPVRIGIMIPQTGEYSGDGPAFRQASQLAADEANANGGMRGRPFQLFFADSESEAPKAGPAAQRLIDEEKVVAIVGGADSSVTLTIEEITNPLKMPQVSCCASTATLTTKRSPADRYVFRTIPSDALQSRAVVKMATEEFSCAKLGVMHADDDYGNPFKDALTVDWKDPLAVTVSLADNATEYSAELQQIVDADPGCVALVGGTETVGQVIREWTNLATKPDVEWILTDAPKSQDLISEAGGAANVDGTRGVAPLTEPDTKEYDEYVSIWTDKYGEAPDNPYAILQFDATAVLLLAYASAASTDGTAVRDALYQVGAPNESGDDENVGPAQLGRGFRLLNQGQDINYQGAGNPSDFDENGDVVSNYEYWRYDMATDDFVRDKEIQASALQ